MDWNPELAGPIVRPIIDRTIAELLDAGAMRVAALKAANHGANPKTVENVIGDLISYGAVRRVGRTGVVRLTTLGYRWACEWVNQGASA